MINAISAADIAFIMSSSTSAWLLSPLECSPQKQNGWTLRFCFWGWIIWKMDKKTIIEFGFRMISWISITSCLCYLPQPSALAGNTDLGFDTSWYHAQPHPIIVYYITISVFVTLWSKFPVTLKGFCPCRSLKMHQTYLNQKGCPLSAVQSWWQQEWQTTWMKFG